MEAFPMRRGEKMAWKQDNFDMAMSAISVARRDATAGSSKQKAESPTPKGNTDSESIIVFPTQHGVNILKLHKLEARFDKR